MKRRSFIKKVGLTAGASLVAPYILPSGRLFAASGTRKANHVVVCLFAGGVRSLESHNYSNGEYGNVMPYTFNGNPSNIEGVDIGNVLGTPSGQSLQQQGTLFNDFKLKNGPTGHYNGHATVLTGVYANGNVNINANPRNPTLFELYRKHNSPSMSALNTWWVSNSLGPYPQLNYSSYPGYGSQYGANHIQPLSFLSSGYNSVYTANDPLTGSQELNNKINAIRGFCDDNFSREFASSAGVVNTLQEKELLNQFIKTNFQNVESGQIQDPWGLGDVYNGDMYTMYFAEEIIKEYQPELLVVNMQNVDTAHNETTEYLNNMKRADYSLHHLWQTIQNTPGMENTILIALPDHGRNAQGNGILDQYGREGTDHSDDQMSREVFCMMLSHQADTSVAANSIINNSAGESVDIVPTVANILGFDNDIPSGLLEGRVLTEAFN